VTGLRTAAFAPLGLRVLRTLRSPSRARALVGSSTRKPFALFALLALAGGAVALPVAHQLSHARAHSHAGDEAPVFGAAAEENDARGPRGGLLLHPKPGAKKHAHAPLSHGRQSVEHYGVATALAAAPTVTIAAAPAVDALFAAPATSDADTSYLLSPLQPGAPPA
jgi:hypothetical protein